MILYHASPDQNLKYLDPKKTESSHNENLPKGVYASTDKSYASAFCFTWYSSEGFKYGKERNIDPWVLKVPPKYAQRLNHPCSLYVVDTKGFKNMNMSTPEYSSRIRVKVISEEKYPTALMCMRKNGVKVSILKRKPFMDNSLINKFKDLIEKKSEMDSNLIQNFKIDKSNIHGSGVIATKEIEPEEVINIAIYKNIVYHCTRFGAHINHSYSPNAITKDKGDRYITYAVKKINPGDEISVDYTVNPELEQPDPSWV